MRIKTYSRYLLEKLLPDDDTGVISFYTPGDKPATVKEGWAAVAFFEIPDTSSYSIDPKTIARLVKTIQQYATQQYDFVVSCDMGVSRSVGVAKAIADAYKIAYRSKFDGNATLYRLVYDQLHAAMPTATTSAFIEPLDR